MLVLLDSGPSRAVARATSQRRGPDSGWSAAALDRRRENARVLDVGAWRQQISDLVLEDEDEAVARCLELSQRLGDSRDPQVRLDVVDALVACATELTGRSCDKGALRVVAEIRSRFAGDPVVRIQTLVAGSLTLAADLHVRAGEPEIAIASYDDALSLVAGSEEMERRGVHATLLLEKGRVLGNHQRREEAVVVLDSALSAIVRATARKPALRTRQVALATTYALDQLCALDRFAEASKLLAQLVDVLSEIPEDVAGDQASLAPEASEAELAAAVADIVTEGECWAIFAGSVAIPSPEAAQRACHLYRLSEPWILSAASEPVEAAAAFVRTIADGYALLAGQRSSAEHHELLHQHGVAEWSRGHGHPLSLTVPSTETGGAQPSSRAAAGPSGARPVGASLIRNIVECLYVYELADVLSQSEHGREALRYKVFAAMAIMYMEFAMNWTRSVSAEEASDGRLAVAVVCLQIAEGFFAITHQPSGSDAPLTPAKERVRGLLHETDGYAWLTGLEVSLPDWTHAKDT
jgi:tetratricopeptide (TPR) repeat protein